MCKIGIEYMHFYSQLLKYEDIVYLHRNLAILLHYIIVAL